MPEPSQTSGLLDAFNPDAVPYALAWIVSAYVLGRLTRKLLASLSKKLPGQRLVIKQVSTLLSFVFYLAAFMLAINSLFTFSSELIFALSGTIAVTVGFALKDVAASFMAGITILVTKPFQVGDRISFGGFYGEVREIGLRTVRLVTLDDNLVSIPTNKFLTEPVASANAGELDCMVVMTFFVSPRAEHQRARDIVEDAVLASKYLYLGKPYTVLVSNKLVDQGSLVIELTAKAYVLDARFEKNFASDVTDRVLATMRAENIPLPGCEFPIPKAESTWSMTDDSIRPPTKN